jgi:hypothetical protein
VRGCGSVAEGTGMYMEWKSATGIERGWLKELNEAVLFS